MDKQNFSICNEKKKQITIDDNCESFYEITNILGKYLTETNPIDLTTKGYKNGTLISSRTTVINNTIKTEEFWKPNYNYEREKVIYDKYNRSFEQIKQN